MDGLSGNREYYRSGSGRMAGFKLWNKEKFTFVEIPFYPNTFFRFFDFILQNRVSQKSKNAMGFSCCFTNKVFSTKKQSSIFFFFSLKLPVLFKIYKFKYGEVREHNHLSEPATETACHRLTFKSMLCLFISAFPQNKHLLFFSIIISAAEILMAHKHMQDKRLFKSFAHRRQVLETRVVICDVSVLL